MAKILTKMFEEKYNDIRIKNNEFLKKSTLFFIILFLSIFFIISAGPTYIENIKRLLSLTQIENLSFIFYIIGLLLFIVSLFSLSKIKKLGPTEEELFLFYTYQTVKNIENFLDNSDLIFLKKRASKNINKIHQRMKYWNIGNFKFLMSKIEKPFTDFTNKFKNKINLIIKYGSDEDITNLIPFFHQVLHFLTMDDPKIDDFLQVTNNFESLKEIYPPKRGFARFIPYYEKITNFINRNNIVKHILHFGIIFGMSCGAYYIGTNIPGVGLGSSYTAGVAVFIGFTIFKLTLIYIRR